MYFKKKEKHQCLDIQNHS